MCVYMFPMDQHGCGQDKGLDIHTRAPANTIKSQIKEIGCAGMTAVQRMKALHELPRRQADIVPWAAEHTINMRTALALMSS